MRTFSVRFSSPIHSFAKQVDQLLWIGLLANISREIGYFKYIKNSIFFTQSAIIVKESILIEINKIYLNVKLYIVYIDRFSYIDPESKISFTTFGSFCSLGRCVSIGLGFHPSNWLSIHPLFDSIGSQTFKKFSKANKIIEATPINNGHDVWIGANAIVLNGITNWTGAKVVAGAGATCDVRPYAIVAGVPAREARRRFDDKRIAELTEWVWWNFLDEDLSSLAEQFNATGNWFVAELKSAIMLRTDPTCVEAVEAVEANNAK
jgi:acetyltransferase-like isoleucine patch superfamily enzyme